MARVSAWAGVSGGRAWPGQEPPGGGLGVRMGGQRVAAGDLAHHQAAALVVVVLAQVGHRLVDLVLLDLGGGGQVLQRDRLGREEEQGLDGALQGVHATRSPAGLARPSIVISPNGSGWSQVASPCL